MNEQLLADHLLGAFYASFMYGFISGFFFCFIFVIVVTNLRYPLRLYYRFWKRCRMSARCYRLHVNNKVGNYASGK